MEKINYTDFLLSSDEEQVQNALKTDHSDESQKMARLEQLHEGLRQWDESSKALHPQIQEERASFINSVGEFNPIVMLNQLGFKTSGPSGVNSKSSYASLNKDDTAIDIITNFQFAEGKTLLRVRRNGEEAIRKYIDLPVNPDQVYNLLADLKLGVNFHSKDIAQYETAYVKQMKQLNKTKK